MSAASRVCPACGEPNPERARFCLACGGQLESTASAREHRKQVTVVFTDLTGSTAMGERLDPETLRGVMSRYYDVMRSVLERHGGRVEKFIGDAVMAAFGVPVLHEDDALRAVRAAVDMRTALNQLNEELIARWEVSLQVRTGINTGPVVAADSSADRFLVGDAVNVAARLEQAASPGQVLLGEVTARLVAGAIALRPTQPVTAKGKSQPVVAFELVEGEAAIDRATADARWPLVGRQAELAALGAAFDRVARERRCRCTCVLGSAGVGKSRLVSEFLAHLDSGTTVLQGRCLSYSERITFWPIVQAIHQAAGISPTDARDLAWNRLAALAAGLDDHDDVIRRVAGVMELSSDEASRPEIFWALRRMLEAIAGNGRLVVVLDDLQWAEPLLLDLIEYLTRSSGSHPILLLCPARPDLTAQRREHVQRDAIVLEPLSDEQALGLIGGLLDGMEVAPNVCQRILQTTAGQPLFVVEYVRMLIDDGSLENSGGQWRFAQGAAPAAIPASVEAVLGARLDRLSQPELEVIEAASVIGQDFYSSAVIELVPDAYKDAVPGLLQALVDKQLVRRDGDGFAGDDGLAFLHLLVRDVAYARLLKQTRSQLHERFTAWLARSAGERVGEYDEILGYHFEQAYRYESELGPLNDRAHRLAAHARRCLTNAGRRALARENAPAAVTLLERTVALIAPGDDPPGELLLELAAAQADVGRLEGAREIIDEVQRTGRSSGDRVLEWRARIQRVGLSFFLTLEGPAPLDEIDHAISALGGLGDEPGLARAWATQGRALAVQGKTESAIVAYEQAVHHARRHNNRRVAGEALTWILILTWAGRTFAPEGARRCQQVLAEKDVPRQATASALVEQAPLLAMLGRFDEARTSCADGLAMLEEMGLTLLTAQMTQERSEVEMLANDPAAAERYLRSGCERLEAMGEQGLLASSVSRLGEALYAQGRYVQAEVHAEQGEQLTVDDDVDGEVRWRRLRAKLLARRGEFTAAEALVTSAVELIAGTDVVGEQGWTLLDLAEVRLLSGRYDDARSAAEQALERFQRKGNKVGAERARTYMVPVGTGR